MKKIQKLALAGLLLSAASAPALAGEKFYVGGTYNNFTLSSDGLDLDLATAGVVGGYKINDILSVEGRLATGVKDQNVRVLVPGGSVPGSVEVDSFVGVNLLTSYPLGTSGLKAYGTLGYGDLKLTVNARGFASQSDSDSSVNYGAGVMMGSGPWNFRLGYENLYQKEGDTAHGINLTVTYAF